MTGDSCKNVQHGITYGEARSRLRFPARSDHVATRTPVLAGPGGSPMYIEVIRTLTARTRPTVARTGTCGMVRPITPAHAVRGTWVTLRALKRRRCHADDARCYCAGVRCTTRTRSRPVPHSQTWNSGRNDRTGRATTRGPTQSSAQGPRTRHAHRTCPGACGRRGAGAARGVHALA